MTIQFSCESCYSTLRVPDDAVGKTAVCPRCQHRNEVSELYAGDSLVSATLIPPESDAPYGSSFAPDTDHRYGSDADRVYQSPFDIDEKSRTWAFWTHLSVLAGMLIPLGNFIVPLVLWVNKREEMPFVNDQGKQVLNFQLSSLLAGFALGIGGVFTCGLTWLLLIPLAIANFVLPIVAALRAKEGEYYRYPWTWTFFS